MLLLSCSLGVSLANEHLCVARRLNDTERVALHSERVCRCRGATPSCARHVNRELRAVFVSCSASRYLSS